MHLFYFKKDFSLPFYDQVSLREHYGFLPWNSTICIIQTPLVFDNVAFSFFLLQTQKFYINFDRSKGKGEKAPNQSNPKNNSQIPKHTDQAIYQKPKILLFCGTIFFTDVYGVTTKHKHIPCQSKWHHKSSVQRQ